jgi:hypothetical protein
VPEFAAPWRRLGPLPFTNLGKVKQKAADMKWWVDDIVQVILWVGTARQGKASKARAKVKAKARAHSWKHWPQNQWH